MQRDLFSAHLARSVEEDAFPIAAARASWPGAEPAADGLGAGHDKPPCAWAAEGRPSKAACPSLTQRMVYPLRKREREPLSV